MISSPCPPIAAFFSPAPSCISSCPCRAPSSVFSTSRTCKTDPCTRQKKKTALITQTRGIEAVLRRYEDAIKVLLRRYVGAIKALGRCYEGGRCLQTAHADHLIRILHPSVLLLLPPQQPLMQNRPTCVCGLKLLVYEALNCMRP